jgi:hypothetical protein
MAVPFKAQIPPPDEWTILKVDAAYGLLAIG